MKTIYKYPLEVKDLVRISMPRGAKVIHAGFDPQERLCVWAIVDTDRPLHVRAFCVAGTGNPFESPDMWEHINTVRIGPFIWHIFVFTIEGGEIAE